jgi:hypothetical protein
MRNRRFLQQNEIFSLLAVFFAVVTAAQQVHLRDFDRVRRELQAILQEKARLEIALKAALDENEQLKAKLAKCKTPIITLSEDRKEFRFKPGEANVSEDFERALLTDIVPALEKLSLQYGCDAIQVIGHTDQTRHDPNKRSDLDARLIGAINGQDAISTLSHASNVDLGMLRALAIVQILQREQATGKIAGIHHFIPYSAGQLIRLDRSLTRTDERESDSSRRRIELHLLNPDSAKQINDEMKNE